MGGENPLSQYCEVLSVAVSVVVSVMVSVVQCPGVVGCGVLVAG